MSGAQGYRRIITGHDAQGRSIVQHDGIAERCNSVDVNLWTTAHRGTGLPDVLLPCYPPAGTATVRFVHLPPDPDPLPQGEAAEAMSRGFFAAAGIEDCRVDTSRHPLAHRTPTTDVIVALSDNISLVLDEGAPVPLRRYDVVVQRATNHAWSVRGPEAGHLLSIMFSNDEGTD